MSAVDQSYHYLVSQITTTLEQARGRVSRQVAHEMVQAYWAIGQHIVEFEQGGADRAAYCSDLLNQLAVDLSPQHARGFSRSNLPYMRKLYQAYPKCETLSHEFCIHPPSSAAHMTSTGQA